MLVRLDARFARGSLAEIQESANCMPEIREGTVVDPVFVSQSHRSVIISYYDMYRKSFPVGQSSCGNGREGSAILAKIIEGRPQEPAMHTRQILDRTFRARVSLRCGYESRFQ